MSGHTPGPWREGRSGVVVADHPVRDGVHDDPSHQQYYGGNLIAESIARHNGPVIAAAPELLAIVQELEWGGELAVFATCPSCDGWAPDSLTEQHSEYMGHRPECRLAAVLAKATGEEKEAQTLNLADLWLVWSYEHDAWWAPNRCGYTRNLTSAGLYTQAQAREIEEDANRGGRRNEEARPFGPYLRDAEHGSVLSAMLLIGMAKGAER